jgi:TPR repeat protein
MAAQAGNTYAMFFLGALLADGLDPLDVTGARHWYEMAAQAGNTDATRWLGALLADWLDPPDLTGAAVARESSPGRKYHCLPLP